MNNSEQKNQSCQTDVRRSIPWTQDEIDSLMGYEWADDSETLDERLDHAIYI